MFSNIPVLFAGLNKLIEKLDKRGEKKITKKKIHTFQSYPHFVRSPSKAIPSHRAPPWAIHRSYWSVLESAVSSEASMNTSTEARQSSIAPSSVQPSTSQSTPTSHSSYSQRMLTLDLSPVGPTNSSQEGGSSDSSDSDYEFQILNFYFNECSCLGRAAIPGLAGYARARRSLPPMSRPCRPTADLAPAPRAPGHLCTIDSRYSTVYPSR